MADEYSSYLKIGAEVEVTSSNHSHRGTLFPAKIVGLGSKTNSYMVEYIHRIEKKRKRNYNVLLSNSLREEVNVGLLRPVAPRETNHTFKFGDNVDAFFDGGWWEGFITEEVIKGLRFGVYFRFSKQQWNFEPSQLRVHREFVKGSWVPPLLDSVNTQENMTVKEELAERKKQAFLSHEGEEVEVRIDEDGFEGAWFGATIISQIETDDKFLVEHKNIKTDDDSEYLRVEVQSNQIRPCPPQVMKNCYYNKEQVEALFNEGWWEGEIFEVLPGEEYRVYFQGTEDEMIFKLSELRPHQVWIQGNWVMNT